MQSTTYFFSQCGWRFGEERFKLRSIPRDNVYNDLYRRHSVFLVVVVEGLISFNERNINHMKETTSFKNTEHLLVFTHAIDAH